MRYRKLDANLDYTFGHGGADYLIDSPQAVAQAIFTTLKLFLGEWFLDVTVGVPWLTQVVGKSQKDTYDQVIKNAIRGVQGVTNLNSYESSLDDFSRVLTIDQVKVDTVYGTVVINGVSSGGGYGRSPYGQIYGG